MLEGLSEPVRTCHERAIEAKTKADETSDPILKASYLAIERRWILLARSYGFAESLKDFTAANAAQRSKLKGRDRGSKPNRIFETARASELLDLLPVAIYVCEPSGLILYYNEQAAQLWGRAPGLIDPSDRFCGSYRMWRLDGDPLPHPECPMADVLRTGTSASDREIVVERPDGSRVVARVNIRALRDARGKILGAVNCFQDITERKRHAEQIAVLAREAEHRSKNILAAVQAMVHLSESDTAHGLKRAIEGRIQALANVQALFLESRWTGAKLCGIAHQELLPYLRDNEPRVRIEGPDVSLNTTVAQAVAVTLHELATNAAKYGALSTAQGSVQVEWSQMANGRILLRWVETGGPLAEEPTHEGFGMRMVKLLTQQINGQIDFHWRPQGMVCEINIDTTV
jgi:two-component sensor histidine kinase/PAS domain-containing protein